MFVENRDVKCFTSVIEQQAIDQINAMLLSPVGENSKVRIMPDVHAGTGCTIGTTMTITDKIVPSIVGVDIGCGMFVVKLPSFADECLNSVDLAAHFVPSGFNTWHRKLYDFDLKELRCYEHLENIDRIECSIGTLGGGNHFIEIDRNEATDELYLVIHSGSRNLGVQVAKYYQDLAYQRQKKDDYSDAVKKLVDGLKAEGRKEEIDRELKKLKTAYKAELLPHDLCYLTGDDMKDYLHDMRICQLYAKINRQMIARTLMDIAGLGYLDDYESFHTVHNYIDLDRMIIRKGAVSAMEGERLLIPINMRDGSLLCTGKGNPDWNFSAPHGAGRIMSRAEAKRTITEQAYRESMNGIYSSTVNLSTIDEAPMAYKRIEDIVDNIEPTVTVDAILKPIYNFKAGEE